jgi:hypothetical protein
MKHQYSNHPKPIFSTILLLTASAVGAGPIAGCRASEHPDDRNAIYQKLTENDLASVEVFQDRHAGTVTLKGVVPSQDGKKKAESLAAQTAPGYTIQNQLAVENTGIVSMAKPNGPAPNGSTPKVTTEPAR